MRSLAGRVMGPGYADAVFFFDAFRAAFARVFRSEALRATRRAAPLARFSLGFASARGAVGFERVAIPIERSSEAACVEG
jgi:hypothetical protein